MINFQFVDLDNLAFDNEVPLFSAVRYEEDRHGVVQDALDEMIRRRKSGMKGSDGSHQVSRDINEDFYLRITCGTPYDPDIRATYNISMIRRGMIMINAPYTHALVETDDPGIIPKIITVIEETLIAQEVHDS